MAASIAAGASGSIVTNPIWVIKTRLMSQSKAHGIPTAATAAHGTASATRSASDLWHYTSTLDAARKMYRTEGIASFYSGLTPSLLGLTHVVVQFPTYEFLKTRFTGYPMGASPPDAFSGEGGTSFFGGVFAASVLSKMLASSATYPHEVIRTRLQTQRRTGSNGNGGGGGNGESLKLKYRGVFSTVRTIWKEEGWRAFYAGMGTNMMRAVPAATVTLLTYEFVRMRLAKSRKEGMERLGLEGG